MYLLPRAGSGRGDVKGERVGSETGERRADGGRLKRDGGL